MLKDIINPLSEGVTLAAIYELDEETSMVWNIYLMNYKELPVKGVLVVSKGHGTKLNKEIETSTLRHFVKEIPAQSVARIEPLQEDLFSINNEYFVTYYVANILYEKKFVFEPYSINIQNAVFITFIGQQGIELL